MRRSPLLHRGIERAPGTRPGLRFPLPNERFAYLDLRLGLVLLPVAKKDVTTLDLAKKPNGYELLAEPFGRLSAGRERHRDERGREEAVRGLVVPVTKIVISRVGR
jgi:hypothetical protein